MSYPQQSGTLTPEGEYEKDLTSHQESKHVPTLATGDGTSAAVAGAKVETVRNVSQLAQARESRRRLLIVQAELYAALKEHKTERWSRESMKLYCMSPTLPSHLQNPVLI